MKKMKKIIRTISLIIFMAFTNIVNVTAYWNNFINEAQYIAMLTILFIVGLAWIVAICEDWLI